MQRSLEVCAYNIQSALIAEKAGAHRVELCDSAAEGGTTPSFGTLRLAREQLNIQLYPIIRPRAGNFLYDELEIAIMKQDILLSKKLGCEGISIGAQLRDGNIDTELMKRFVEWSYPMGVTCHRVFDVTPDPFKSLEELIECGCERILTSGQQKNAVAGAALLAKLVEQADDRIIIMPGAGVRSANIQQLIQHTGAREFHTSAKKVATDNVTFQPAEVRDMGEVFIADEQELIQILQHIKKDD